MNEDIRKQIEKNIVEISSRQRRDFTNENLVLRFWGMYPSSDAKQLADLITKQMPALARKFGISENTVKRILKACHLSYWEDKRCLAVLEAAWKAGAMLMRLLSGAAADKELLAKYYRSQVEINNHPQAKRLILISLFSQPGSSFSEPAYQAMMRLNKDFAAESLDSVSDILENMQKTPVPPSVTPNEKLVFQMEAEAQKQTVENLRKSLQRSRELLGKLQDDFEERLEESKAEERERFFSKLNDERYGYILDLLAIAQDGFCRLREKGGVVPTEVKSTQTLVRRLLSFVEDCGVVPMTEIGEVREVGIKDMDSLNFEGDPFDKADQRKMVEVISPGWKIEDSDIVISYPRVREIIKE